MIILLQIAKGYISASMMQNNNWRYSSVVDHSTADRVIIILQIAKGYISASII